MDKKKGQISTPKTETLENPMPWLGATYDLFMGEHGAEYKEGCEIRTTTTASAPNLENHSNTKEKAKIEPKKVVKIKTSFRCLPSEKEMLNRVTKNLRDASGGHMITKSEVIRGLIVLASQILNSEKSTQRLLNKIQSLWK